MTATLEIPRERWEGFLESLSSGVLGRPVSLEVETLEIGDQILGQHLPLRGIDLDTKGSGAGDVHIMLGLDEVSLSHEISEPRRIWIGYRAATELEWLAIEHADHGHTLLYFDRLPEIPEDFPDELEP